MDDQDAEPPQDTLPSLHIGPIPTSLAELAVENLQQTADGTAAAANTFAIRIGNDKHLVNMGKQIQLLTQLQLLPQIRT